VRFATPDSLENYVASVVLTRTGVSLQAAREEEFFLGLRLTRGVDLKQIGLRYGMDPQISKIVAELQAAGLIEQSGEVIRLTPRGRLLSNEVFERFLDQLPASQNTR